MACSMGEIAEMPFFATSSQCWSIAIRFMWGTHAQREEQFKASDRCCGVFITTWSASSSGLFQVGEIVHPESSLVQESEHGQRKAAMFCFCMVFGVPKLKELEEFLSYGNCVFGCVWTWSFEQIWWLMSRKFPGFFPLELVTWGTGGRVKHQPSPR